MPSTCKAPGSVPPKSEVTSWKRGHREWEVLERGWGKGLQWENWTGQAWRTWFDAAWAIPEVAALGIQLLE